MNILRTVSNRIVGRKKTLEERFDGLEDVHSLLKNTPESLFEIRYNDKVKTYKKEHVYPEKVSEFISNFVQVYPNVKLECSHTVFSGKDMDKHYIDVVKLHPNESGKYSMNRSVKINYMQVK